MLRSLLGRSLGRCAAALAMIAALWAVPAQAGEPRAEAGMARRPPQVVVRGVFPVSPPELRAACGSLIKMFEPFPLRCHVADEILPLSTVDAEWDRRRQQVDARKSLERMFRERGKADHVEILIISSDLFEPGKEFVFGMASPIDRVAIVSTARIGDDGGDGRRVVERLQKLVRHELGHAFGLGHHQDDGCTMRSDPDVASLDRAPFKPCRRCHRILFEQAGLMSRPGQIALDHARSYLARGELHGAKTYVDALKREPVDVTILNEIAMSFLDAGQVEIAVDILAHTVTSAPEFAHAHINYGIALQQRNRQGDLWLAHVHIERAAEIEPVWATYAARLLEDIAYAQGASVPASARAGAPDP